MVWSAPVVALVLGVIVVGAVLQRLSGSGMGLVLAPTLALLLGAATGVLVANATTTVSGLLMLLALRRDVDWRRAALLCAAGVPGAFIGAWLVRALSAGWLQVVVGGVVLLAIGVTVVAGALGRLPRVSSPLATPLAGLLGGVFNTTAGVAAPVLVVHARLTDWEQRSFAATLQPVFMTMGAVSVLVKTLTSTADAAVPPWWMLPAVVLTVVAGIRLGRALEPHVPADRARTLALALAALGGLSALVRGLLAVA